ncbi:glycosyltransferase [Thermococcus waiotapuensis]|uniref:Glycosyltransferase n=1 Tax=Thermococcus waiotapuensis TaxID=90909 RepID=A0AAE4T1S7_9EURY|nr:glycosyltransferase [Thermococcus waiotapuensis]MDV3104555.1 glycosyltransferase [Thermococcus waiotapuensis]
MKVAMVTPHGDPLGKLGEPDTGGQCVYVKELSRHLGALGVKVDIFTRQRGGRKEIEYINENVRVIRIECGPEGFIPKEKLMPYLPEFTDKVSEYFKKEGYDIVHTHYWDGGFVGMELKERHGVKMVHTSHSLGILKAKALGDFEPYRERIELEKRIYETSNAIVATTEIEKKDIASLYGVDEGKIYVIPIGVDTTFYKPLGDKKELKRELGLPKVPLVFTLARLDPRKGLDLLIKSVPYIKEYYQRDFLVLISTGTGAKEEEKEMNKLLSLIEELKVKEHVKIIPAIEPVSMVPKYYSAADVFVLPSPYEPFGIVMLEAMACKTPIVATKFGGPAEVLQDGYDGFLVDPKDSKEMGKKIALLLEDEELRQIFAERAYRKVTEKYSWDSVAREMRNLYEKLWGEKTCWTCYQSERYW